MKRLILLIAMLMVLSCGGGGNGSDPPNTPPTTPPLECGENEVEHDGECVCIDTYERDSNNKCVPIVVIPPEKLIVRLQWEPVVHPDLSGYKMYRTTVWCEYSEENVVSYLSNNSVEYTMGYSFDPSVINLFEDGVTYYFTIKAYAIYDYCEGLPADCTAPSEIEESDLSNQVYCTFDEDAVECLGTNPDPEEYCNE